jgi:raffinose/stachyose/melibiose transport system permease protein
MNAVPRRDGLPAAPGAARYGGLRRWRLANTGRSLEPHMRLPVLLSLLPALALFGVFFLVPIAMLVGSSLTHWSVLGMRWAAVDNWSRLIHDHVFWKALRNTAFYAGAAVLVQIPLAVICAMALATKIPGWRLFRTILFIPVVISGAAYALVFSMVYNSRYGLFNQVLGLVGLDRGHDWLFDTGTALPAMIGTYIFAIGFFMILVLAEITSIPTELYEAAQVDGASQAQRHVRITLPLLRNVIGTCILLSLLSTLALFDIVFILTQGGPNDATLTLTVYAFRNYTADQWGYASTIGVATVVFGLIVIVSVRRIFRIGERLL